MMPIKLQGNTRALGIGITVLQENVSFKKIADRIRLFVLNLLHKRENAGNRCVVFKQFPLIFSRNSVTL